MDTPCNILGLKTVKLRLLRVFVSSKAKSHMGSEQVVVNFGLDLKLGISRGVEC